MKKITAYICSVFLSLTILKAQSVLNQPLDNDTIECIGTIVKHAFVNKNGKINDSIAEYYFKLDDSEYFIKLCEGSVKKNELKIYENKMLKVKAKIKTGLWDDGCVKSAEIPQSRGGSYIVLLSIINPVHLFLQYADGNGNIYKIENNTLKYIPVTPKNSSSGTYSGGAPVIKQITDEQVQKLNDAFATIFENKKIHFENRVMGSGALKRKTTSGTQTIIIGNGQEKDNLEKMLIGIKTN